MTKKHTAPQARRDAEATLRAMAGELGHAYFVVQITDNSVSISEDGILYVMGDSLDDAFQRARRLKNE